MPQGTTTINKILMESLKDLLFHLLPLPHPAVLASPETTTNKTPTELQLDPLYLHQQEALEEALEITNKILMEHPPDLPYLHRLEDSEEALEAMNQILMEPRPDLPLLPLEEPLDSELLSPSVSAQEAAETLSASPGLRTLMEPLDPTPSLKTFTQIPFPLPEFLPKSLKTLKGLSEPDARSIWKPPILTPISDPKRSLSLLPKRPMQEKNRVKLKTVR